MNLALLTIIYETASTIFADYLADFAIDRLIVSFFLRRIPRSFEHSNAFNLDALNTVIF